MEIKITMTEDKSLEYRYAILDKTFWELLDALRSYSAEPFDTESFEMMDRLECGDYEESEPPGHPNFRPDKEQLQREEEETWTTRR